MTPYQLFPNLNLDEMEALTADIKARGVMVPVEKDEAGNILDGHHRVMIADSLGVDYPTVIRDGWSEDQKLTHVVALNAHRRHLTPVERAEVVARLAATGMSKRAIAKAVNVARPTVDRDLSGGSVVPPERVVGSDGKSYPAYRPTLADDVDRIAQRPAVVEATQRSRWSGLIAGSARVLTEATPDYWADRLDPGQSAAMRSHLVVLRGWIDAWDRALDRPALRSLGGIE